jgi:YbgC/YbaW family acyl-CoA thioester hydrolase
MDRTEPFSREELSNTPALYSEARTVRFQDVDAAGLIFFARILEYFHDAMIALFARSGLDLPAVLRAGAWGMPLVRTEADYIRPLRFGDAISVEVVGIRLGEHSAIIGYRLRTSANHVAAVGQAFHAFIDRQQFKPCPIPAAARSALEPLVRD